VNIGILLVKGQGLCTEIII